MQKQSLQLRPCIAEILRTCIVPSLALFRVEYIVPKKKDVGKESATRVYVSDGHLALQALLWQPPDRDLRNGDLIEVTDFEVRKGRRINSRGHVVYFGIKSCTRVTENVINEVDEEEEGGFIRDAPTTSTSVRKRSQSAGLDDPNSTGLHNGNMATPKSSSKRRCLREESGKGPEEWPSVDNQSASDQDDDFETLATDPSSVAQRRKTLRDFTAGSHPDVSDEERVSAQTQIPNSSPKTAPEMVVQPKSSAQPTDQSQRPLTQLRALSDLPVHSLASLRDPRSKLPKSYQCSVFGIITYISPNIIRKPPFPPKRHVKIHDVSIASQHYGITLAVFVDAEHFTPPLGTVALFRGITVQKWGGDIILNAYKALQDRGDDCEWLISDMRRLEVMDWDVQELQIWWKQKQLARPVSRGSDK